MDTKFLSDLQRKFTAGDLIMLDSDLGVDIGTRITLDKVTLVGSRDFTLLGRPVLPRDLVRVEATVVEKNLSKTEVCNSEVLMPLSDLMNSCSNSNWLITWTTTLFTFFSLLQIYFDSGIQRKGNVLKPLKKVCNTKYKCE